MMPLPSTISITMDVPIDFKVASYDTYFCYMVNLEYKCVAVHSFNEDPDGTKHYHFSNTHAIMEMPGGLAFFDYGWKIMPKEVQERYADYIAEKEIFKE